MSSKFGTAYVHYVFIGRKNSDKYTSLKTSLYDLSPIFDNPSFGVIQSSGIQDPGSFLITELSISCAHVNYRGDRASSFASRIHGSC
jgi:hypothetical protein